MTVTVRTFRHVWNAAEGHYDRQSIPPLQGFCQWMGATCSSFKSVAGAKRAIRSSKEECDFVITEEKFAGDTPTQVWVAFRSISQKQGGAA